MRARRAAWRRRQASARGRAEAPRYVVVDESGANTAMARTHGRAPPGERVAGPAVAVPHGHWKTLTLIAALRPGGLAAAATVDAPADADVFRAFVRESLAPALRPGDVVVMDNLASHKAAGVREAIEAAGAQVRYLPPYSPDLSPIEPMWSKVKHRLRDAAARTADALGEAAQHALAAVTASDARGWFSHCGYAVQ